MSPSLSLRPVKGALKLFLGMFRDIEMYLDNSCYQAVTRISNALITRRGHILHREVRSIFLFGFQILRPRNLRFIKRLLEICPTKV